MNSTGMNTAASEKVIERMVKPISLAPSSDAVITSLPISMWRTMFSSMTMASSTTNPTRERNRHQREVVERVVERPHDGESADDRHRQREARDDRRRQVAQEQEDHHHDQEDGQQQRELHVVDRGANRLGVVAERVDMQRGRNFGPEGGNQAHHVVDDFDGVGAGLTLDREHDRALAVGPSGGLVVLHAVEHAADVLEPHRANRFDTRQSASGTRRRWSTDPWCRR